MVTPIRIGITTPNTSSIPIYKSIINLVKEDINTHCEDNNLNFSFDFSLLDNQGRSDIALKNTQAFKAEGINLIIGHGWSSQCQASLSYVNQNEMLLLSPSSTSPVLAIPNDNLFRLCPNDYYQTTIMIEILKSYNIKGIIIIQRGDSWADGVVNVLENEYVKKGGKILGRLRYPTDESNFLKLFQQAEDILTNSLHLFPINQLAIEFLSFGEFDVLPQISTFSNLSKITWFTPDGIFFPKNVTDSFSNLLLKIKLIGLNPAIIPSNKYKDIFDNVHNTTKQFLTYYTASIYDACWLYVNSILITKSCKTMSVKKILPNVSSHYFGLSGLCLLDKNGDRFAVNYNILGYGKRNKITQNIIYGYYNSDFNKVFYPQDNPGNLIHEIPSSLDIEENNEIKFQEKIFTEEAGLVKSFAKNLKYFNYNFASIFKTDFIFPHIDDWVAFPDLYIPCQTEDDFVRKLLILASIFNRIEKNKLKKLIKTNNKEELNGSINLLELILIEQKLNYKKRDIDNLRSVLTLRNMMYPAHPTSSDLKKALMKVGIEEYPLDDWEDGWKSLLQLCTNSLIGLTNVLIEKQRN